MSNRMKAYLLLGLAVVALGAVAMARPIARAVAPEQPVQWTAVVGQAKAAEAQALLQPAVSMQPPRQQFSPAAAPQSDSDAFGRQLDSITSFYETIIGLLLVALTIVGAFGLWSVSFLSKAKAEEIAREVMSGSDFRRSLRELVDSAVLKTVAEKTAEINELRAQVELLSEESDLNIEGVPNGDS
jgi:hypothetical protein